MDTASMTLAGASGPPAGPEKSAAVARPTVRVGTWGVERCVIGMYLSTLG